MSCNDSDHARTFFQLAPANDVPGPHICMDCAATIAKESEAESLANMEAAIALGNSLLEALDVYTDAHEETTYRHIFEALAYISWCLQQERDEEAYDA